MTSQKIFGLSASLILVASLGASSCLKTRAQLKEEGGTERDTPSRATQAEPAKHADANAGGYVLDEIKSEITRLNGRIEDLERQQKQQEQGGGASSESAKKLEQRINELEKTQQSLQEELKRVQTSTAPANPEEIYTKARQQYDGGELAEAIESFTHYLKAANPAHAEEAYYLRGESYYRLKEYKKAILDYSKFSEKYTKSKRAPAALMKIGLSFEALGMKDDAKGFYQELVEKYPKSPEAKKVRTKVK